MEKELSKGARVGIVPHRVVLPFRPFLTKSNLVVFIVLLLATGALWAGDLTRILIDPASITASPWDIGPLSNLVDGSVDTILRSANVNPAFVQVELSSAAGIKKIRVSLGELGFAGDVNTWWVEAADSKADMDAQAGSYQMVVAPRAGVAGGWDEANLTEVVTRRIWRFTIYRSLGDNYVHIRELELWAKLTAPPLPVSAVTSDATYVELHWDPVSSEIVQEYAVYRDGTAVGSTVSKTGYFHDFGLSPNQTYSYEVVALGINGLPVAKSDSIAVSTKAASAIKTHYTILAIAFNPDTTAFDGATTYLKHRSDFLKLASLGSAVIEPYKNGIVWIAEDPPLVTGSATKTADLVKTITTSFPQLDGYSIADLVEKGDIDGVWLVSCSADGFGENTLFGNRTIGLPDSAGETWIPKQVKCSRSFFVNAYSSDERSYDAYTHMVEGIMSSICDSYPENWPRDTEYLVFPKTRSDRTPYRAQLHLFERFRLADEWNGVGAYASKGNANCGSSHFPPNTRFDAVDYAYFDLGTWQRYVDCVADDWLMFPDLSSRSRKINGYDFGALNDYQENDLSYASTFGASPELHRSFSFGSTSYHQWWFRHLPHNPGVTNGKLNNWWPYLFDFNRFDGRAIDYEVTGFPEVLANFSPLGGEYGTEEDQPAHWGYWHSDNGFSPFGKNGVLSIVSKRDEPTNVNHGEHALQVEIENAQLLEWGDHGRNDLFYPNTRNARWDFSDLSQIRFSIKLGNNPDLVAGVNPIVRLCANDGNRIEFVPVRNGAYVNLFLNPTLQEGCGWFRFAIPAGGNSEWERNVFGYIDPSLSEAEQKQARRLLEQDILAEVNYVEVSIKTTRNYPANANVEYCSFWLDGLEFGFSSANLPPMCRNDNLGTIEGTSVEAPIAKILANDSDPEDDVLMLTAVPAKSQSGGDVALVGNMIRYTPPSGFVGADCFTYTVSDGHGNTAQADVLVTVRPDAEPSRNNISITMSSSGPLLRFAGIPGQNYVIQTKEAVAGPWLNLSTTLTAGSAGLIAYYDTRVPVPPVRFYRTIAVP